MVAGEASIWQPRKLLQLSADTKRIEERLTAIAGQTLFTLKDFTYVLNTGSLEVHKSGLLLTKGVDWVENTISTFSLVVPTTAGDQIVAVGYVAITGNVDVRDTDIFEPNYQALRDYAGMEISLWIQGQVTHADGGESFFQLVTGAAPGFYVDNNYNIVIPTGGDGSSAWVCTAKPFVSVANMRKFDLAVGTKVATKGYYTEGDGGEADYLVSVAQAFDNFCDHELSGGSVAKIQYDGILDIAKCGCVGAGDKSIAFEAVLVRSQAETLPLAASQSFSVPAFASTKSYINIVGVDGVKPTISDGNRISISGDILVKNIKLKDWVRPLMPIATISSFVFRHNEMENCKEGIRNDGSIDPDYDINGIDICYNNVHSVPVTSDKSGFVFLINNIKDADVSFNTITEIRALQGADCQIIVLGGGNEDTLKSNNISCKFNKIKDSGRPGSAAEDDKSYAVLMLGSNLNAIGNQVDNVDSMDPIYAKGQGISLTGNNVTQHEEGGVTVKAINATAGGFLDDNSKANTITGNTIRTDKARVSGGGSCIHMVNEGTVSGNSVNATGTDWIGLEMRIVETLDTSSDGQLISANNSIVAPEACLIFGGGDYIIADCYFKATSSYALQVAADGALTAESVKVSGSTLKAEAEAAMRTTIDCVNTELHLSDNTIIGTRLIGLKNKTVTSSNNKYIVNGLVEENACIQWKPQVNDATLTSDNDTCTFNTLKSVRSFIFVNPSIVATGIEVTVKSVNINLSAGTSLQKVFRMDSASSYNLVDVSGTRGVNCADLVGSTTGNAVSRMIISNNIADLTGAFLSGGAGVTGATLLISGNVGAGAVTSGTVTYTASLLTGNVLD